MSFNPFGKKLSDVTAEDLEKLKDISEGWYVDYKRKLINIKDIGKHLCAFANQFGGYLIFGVTESSDQERKAEVFNGISSSDVEKALTLVREASDEHASPPIVYDEAVIQGPCEKIGLEDKCAIVIIQIFASFEPPHIHSSGKIYIRQADQSKPKPVTDRYLLDKMLDRREKTKKRISDNINNIPRVHTKQEGNSFVYVNILPDPYTIQTGKDLSFEDFCSCVNPEDKQDFGDLMPMQTMFPCKNGFVAKQVMDNDPGLATASIRFWHDRSVRFEIPVNTGTPDHIFSQTGAKSYKYFADFYAQYEEQNFNGTHLCDLSHIGLALRSMCNMYLHMLDKIGEKTSCYATFEIRNIFYKIPFIDTAKYVSRCSKYGIPVVQEENIKYREEPYFDNMFHIKKVLGVDSIERSAAPYYLADPINILLRMSLGLQSDVSDYDYSEDVCQHLANRDQ
ncbi:AlbA family DNA-binding domain-containing protein [Pseudodesulfovibrio sediminis]|uniref:ATPase AAA n=1 Tax=Pseudodesulfovibrio sediminis TaxID=2810563 RepID=A0ABM7P228_9BACT|nr:ATP-binding protein [Pseudodesulfovibrio sediminis]BCS86953.1 ATPase AAA [Pseudodesulfovibrio sediminis]